MPENTVYRTVFGRRNLLRRLKCAPMHNNSDTFRTPDLSGISRHICTCYPVQNMQFAKGWYRSGQAPLQVSSQSWDGGFRVTCTSVLWPTECHATQSVCCTSVSCTYTCTCMWCPVISSEINGAVNRLLSDNLCMYILSGNIWPRQQTPNRISTISCVQATNKYSCGMYVLQRDIKA